MSSKIRYTHEHLIPSGRKSDQDRVEGDRSIRTPRLTDREKEIKKWREGDAILRAGDAAGDWHCPKCGNVNWAKRSSCNVCKATRAELMELATREGSGGGFCERDLEEEKKRKRRREDEERETKKRKEDKVRCKFCKRFKCIC